MVKLPQYILLKYFFKIRFLKGYRAKPPLVWTPAGQRRRNRFILMGGSEAKGRQHKVLEF
ncbi:hypothetical protein X928_09180 [Petrotoga miotherma DSM 10691]|uniref:Uncharacterized protein n=2 Tax=Petrotoga TaxID=28236 RepID=A0A2K1P6U1_9BACT|nr:hypothetical protein X928_09180 [Petrotoga miotherma DSM 10691]POZ92627.1 hypothetical protein AA81_05990 [Petrotoga halophila DSM 16923]